MPVLLMAQLFAVMPLYGFTSAQASSLRFVWRSYRVVHSLVIAGAVLVMSLLSIAWMARDSVSMQRLGIDLRILPVGDIYSYIYIL